MVLVNAYRLRGSWDYRQSGVTAGGRRCRLCLGFRFNFRIVLPFSLTTFLLLHCHLFHRVPFSVFGLCGFGGLDHLIMHHFFCKLGKAGTQKEKFRNSGIFGLKKRISALFGPF